MVEILLCYFLTNNKKTYFRKASFQIICEEWIVNPSKINLNSKKKKKATKGINFSENQIQIKEVNNSDKNTF